MGVAVKVRVWVGWGWFLLQKILNRHFEKHLHAMELKLTGYIIITISLMSQKIW